MKNIQNIEPEYLLLKENLWQSYANVEAEMAKAQSQVGIIPKQAAIIIKKKSNFSKKNFAEVEKFQKKNKKTVLSIVKVLAKKVESLVAMFIGVVQHVISLTQEINSYLEKFIDQSLKNYQLALENSRLYVKKTQMCL